MILSRFNLPRSPFDIQPEPYGTPGIGDGLPQNQPAEAFVWGQGGARLTPDQIAREHDVAAALLASGSDTSPVGHWAQGLARAMNGLMGGLRERRADKREEAANADRSAMIAQMLGPENADLAGAVSSGDKVVAALAGDILKSRTPDAPSYTEFQKNLMGAGIQPGSPEWIKLSRQKAENDADRFVNFVSGGETIAGPWSQVAPLMREGGDPQVSPTPGAGGSTAPASADPGTNFMTVDQYRTVKQGLGSGFSAWVQQHQVPVLVNSPEEMAGLPSGTPVVSRDGRRGVKK